MTLFDDHPELGSVVELVQAAALGSAAWSEALDAAAHVTQSTSGQLIGFGAGGHVTFNWQSGLDPQCMIEFDAIGGNDGRINSRIPIGLAAAELEILDERHFTTEADRAKNSAYSDCLERWNISHVCLTNLVKSAELGVGFALNRSPQEGGMSVRQFREFSVLAHHFRHAVRVQHMMEGQASHVASGLLDRMETMGVVCFRDARVGSASASAEQCFREGSRLRLRNGALAPAHGDANCIAMVVNQTLAGRVCKPIVVRDARGQNPLIVEVAPLPFRNYASAFDEAVLVIVRDRGQGDRSRMTTATAMFGYTPTEARVATAMVAGHSPLAIATNMQVEIATVRTHIRRLYEKSGVSSQLGLSSLLGSIR